MTDQDKATVEEMGLRIEELEEQQAECHGDGLSANPDHWGHESRIDLLRERLERTEKALGRAEEHYAKTLRDLADRMNRSAANYIAERDQIAADFLVIHGRMAKAEKSLHLAGYTDHGGELWKPPLGKRPDFEGMAALRAERDAAHVAIRAIVARWETPPWKEAAPTAEVIYAARNLLPKGPNHG